MARETAAATAGPAGSTRAAARRPRVVLVDVFETMLRVDALGSRFVDVGRRVPGGSPRDAVSTGFSAGGCRSLHRRHDRATRRR